VVLPIKVNRAHRGKLACAKDGAASKCYTIAFIDVFDIHAADTRDPCPWVYFHPPTYIDARALLRHCMHIYAMYYTPYMFEREGGVCSFRCALVFYGSYKQPDAEQVRASKWEALRIICNKVLTTRQRERFEKFCNLRK